MIELQRIEDPIFEGRTWTDASNTHVIVEETPETLPHRLPAPGFYVRDEDGERGPFDDLSQAFAFAQKAWGEVTLAPANRLRTEIAKGRADEVGHFLLEYLADYGAVGIDAQALAQLVFERIGADEEAWG